MPARVMTTYRGGAIAALTLLAAALVAALAFAVTRAEAAGHEFGDSFDVDGEIDGTAADVLGQPDGAIVQIGTSAGGGSITVSFDDNVAFDGPGADVRIHTLDALDPATAEIELSADGVNFVSAGNFADDGGDVDIDLDDVNLHFATAVRITHVSGALPGFDLDAVEAINVLDPAELDACATPGVRHEPGRRSALCDRNADRLGRPGGERASLDRGDHRPERRRWRHRRYGRRRRRVLLLHG